MKKLVLFQIFTLIFILGGFFGIFTTLNGWEMNIPQFRCLIVFFTGLFTAFLGGLVLLFVLTFFSNFNKILCLDIFAAVAAMALVAFFALFSMTVYNFFVFVVGSLSAGLFSGGTAVICAKNFIEKGYKKRALFVPSFIEGTVIFAVVVISTITLF